MTDWLGLAFFAALAVGVYFGLRSLSRPTKRTEEEFERGAEESGSMIGAGVAALQGILDPSEQRAKIEIAESKQGRYIKRSVAGETGVENKSDTNAPENDGRREELK
jgi:hypothetical protein